MFIDGFDQSICTFVAKRHQYKWEPTYLELVQYANAEEDAIRAHSGSRVNSRALRLRAIQSSISMMPQHYNRTKIDNLALAREDLTCFPITELPLIEASQREDTQLLYADCSRFRAPQAHHSAGFRSPMSG